MNGEYNKQQTIFYCLDMVTSQTNNTSHVSCFEISAILVYSISGKDMPMGEGKRVWLGFFKKHYAQLNSSWSTLLMNESYNPPPIIAYTDQTSMLSGIARIFSLSRKRLYEFLSLYWLNLKIKSTGVA
ncbi:Transcriptional regulator, GntR family [Candida maltosa Xu316]|uniref:Transcriptional regulator, GntR family n=1 Tax=Candida maltosa (strain Xu316) TaxID=1245528 RepID=M3JS87_CANMX|nr:Transcriptional regulator, GntR family [Candida maltosa Xu316]